ncbi:M48 family metallopeptidase [Candidatus Microgenomates bacterium]|nr:M48 family metallopeptidase [Candidatus Microgenomates bacterium]
MKNIYEVQKSNKIKSTIVVVFFALFVALAVYVISQAFGIYLGYEPGGLGFVGIALIISGVSTYVSYYFSDRIVLGISGARKANTQEDRLFTSVVENICLGAGIPRPKLYVIEDTAPNAFATGRDPKNAVVCATTGLLTKLTRTELEAVMAHEISHIRNYDIRLMSVVSVMVGLVALLADFFLRARFFGNHMESGGGKRSSSSKDNQLGTIIMIVGILFALLSPLVAKLIQLSISRRREFMADAGSVSITRQPSAMISALKKISSDTEALEAANKATAHLYIINPFKQKTGRAAEKFSSLFNTHPLIADRISTLQKMM